MLAAVLASAPALELLLREDRTWGPLVLAVSLVVALTCCGAAPVRLVGVLRIRQF